jgi:hypothetical protein
MYVDHIEVLRLVVLSAIASLHCQYGWSFVVVGLLTKGKIHEHFANPPSMFLQIQENTSLGKMVA